MRGESYDEAMKRQMEERRRSRAQMRAHDRYGVPCPLCGLRMAHWLLPQHQGSKRCQSNQKEKA